MQVKVRDTKSNAAAYQSVDSHNKSFFLVAIKTVLAFKHKVGMMIAEWKPPFKVRYLKLEKGYLYDKTKLGEILE